MTPPSGEPTRTVEIPERLAERIEGRIEATEFDGVSEYVGFSLERLLRQLDQQTDASGDCDAAQRSAEEGDEAVRDQLESLGYL